MKKLILFLLLSIVVVVVVLNYKSKSPDGEKTYPQKLVNALDQATLLSLDLKVNDIKAALNMYYADKNQYPETLDMLTPEYLKMQDQLLDPWGSPFKIETDEEMNLVLISRGKDKIPQTEDDIKRRL
jgi:hypothetical protein